MELEDGYPAAIVRYSSNFVHIKIYLEKCLYNAIARMERAAEKEKLINM